MVKGPEHWRENSKLLSASTVRNAALSSPESGLNTTNTRAKESRAKYPSQKKAEPFAGCSTCLSCCTRPRNTFHAGFAGSHTHMQACSLGSSTSDLSRGRRWGGWVHRLDLSASLPHFHTKLSEKKSLWERGRTPAVGPWSQ